jgi:CRP-like cAMP-binding protein
MRSAAVQRNENAGRFRDVRTAAGKPVRNGLLLQLPESEFSRIKPHLEAIKFEVADLLERQNVPAKRVYFLNTGIASLLIETSDARSVEVGVSGREHVIGLVPLLGGLTLAVGELERRGVILPNRGAIRITDRAGLEEQSCECYAVLSNFNAELGLGM